MESSINAVKSRNRYNFYLSVEVIQELETEAANNSVYAKRDGNRYRPLSDELRIRITGYDVLTDYLKFSYEEQCPLRHATCL